MGVLTPDKVNKDISDLLDYLEKSQWNFIPNFISLLDVKVINRIDLRNIEMKDDVDISKSSGSTGEPVSVGKSYKDYIWYTALSIRELRWLKWDVTKNISVIKAGNKNFTIFRSHFY